MSRLIAGLLYERYLLSCCPRTIEYGVPVLALMRLIFGSFDELFFGVNLQYLLLDPLYGLSPSADLLCERYGFSFGVNKFFMGMLIKIFLQSFL